jgi:hypothetical protein
MNEDILDNLRIIQMVNYIQNYQRKWKEHVNKVNTGGILKQILHC